MNITLPNGDRYEGETVKGEREGQGMHCNTRYRHLLFKGRRQVLRQLAKWESAWGRYSFDRLIILGKIELSNGARYLGDFENGIMQGMGIEKN